MDTKICSLFHGRIQQIFLYITDNCNYDCAHCLIGNRKKNKYSLESASRILEKMRALGAVKVTLIGGEPTLHDELLSLIVVAKSMGYEVVLDTNGTFAYNLHDKPEFNSLDMICFSVDGYTADIHDSFRRAGSFRQIMKHIRILKAHKSKIKITHTINADNLFDSHSIIDFALDLDIDELNFHIGTYNGRGKNDNRFKVVPHQAWYKAYHEIKQKYHGYANRKTKLRIPPRYCTRDELVTNHRNHNCAGKLCDRLLILPKDEISKECGGPLYGCGLLIGESQTMGWNIDGKFHYNDSVNGEYGKYYKNDLPSVDGIPICPIISLDRTNPNHIKSKSIVPLCISYKPAL